MNRRQFSKSATTAPFIFSMAAARASVPSFVVRYILNQLTIAELSLAVPRAFAESRRDLSDYDVVMNVPKGSKYYRRQNPQQTTAAVVVENATSVERHVPFEVVMFDMDSNIYSRLHIAEYRLGAGGTQTVSVELPHEVDVGRKVLGVSVNKERPVLSDPFFVLAGSQTTMRAHR